MVSMLPTPLNSSAYGNSSNMTSSNSFSGAGQQLGYLEGLVSEYYAQYGNFSNFTFVNINNSNPITQFLPVQCQSDGVNPSTPIIGVAGPP